MTAAGRTPGVNHAKKVREYFEANRNRDIALDELRIIIGEGEPADVAKTRGVVNYLRTQRNMKITVVKRGEVWRYNKNTRKRAVPRESIDEQVDDFIKNTNQPPEFAEPTVIPYDKVLAGTFGGKEAVERMATLLGQLEIRDQADDRQEVLTLRVIGTSTDGYVLGLNELSGNVFKVVPL